MQEENLNTDVESQVVAGNDGVIEDVAEPQLSDKELNFKALRESHEDERKRRIEAEERARQYEQALMEKQQAKNNTDPDEDERIDFSDAVDAETFAKISKKLDRQEKKLQRRLEEIEQVNRQQYLAAKDPAYIDVINNYLPGVLKGNPAVKDIIKKAPSSQQYELMYQFATSNPDYVIEKHVKKAKKENRIVEEEKPNVNTLGALKSGSSAVGKESALAMSHDSFYGDGGYLSKILENKIQ